MTRIWEKFKDYCLKEKLIETRDAFDNGPVSGRVPELVCFYIAHEYVIMSLPNHSGLLADVLITDVMKLT